MEAQTQAAIAAKLAHAAQHAQTLADRLHPHYVWEHGKTEVVLYREYPAQGMRVRQSDVTIWSKQ